MKKTIFLLMLSALILTTLTGCSKKIEYIDVADYADSITTSILNSINDLDYYKFSSYLSDDLKESYDIGTFQSETAEIINNIGSFQSLSFYAGQESNGYISIIYNVQYSDSDENIPVSVTFKKDDETHKVYELYFDSTIIDK